MIYTLGTSSRSLEELLALLKEHGIEVAVDIRSFPTSRFPHFKREALEGSLPTSGIRYHYLGRELGGYRKGGYLAHMETDSFQEGLKRLEEIGQGSRVAFFCSERFPWHCHRRWVAAKLIERGWQVIHILDKGRTWIPTKGPQGLTQTGP